VYFDVDNKDLRGFKNLAAFYSIFGLVNLFMVSLLNHERPSTVRQAYGSGRTVLKSN
jgi:hypothetical protein